MAISPARTAAFHALASITAGRADLPSALAHARTRLDDERDRGLTAAIVTGTLRWQRHLDYLIEHISRRPLSKLDASVLVITRLSLYQILHLDRVPAAAVVDDAVNLTRAAKKPSATGFVNAVLRSTLRQRHRLPVPSRPTDARNRDEALAYLGITLSHPDWLVARWLDRYGFEHAERWAQFNNGPAPLTLRANRLRTSREAVQQTLAAEDIETETTRYAPDGLIVTAGNPLRRPLDGTFLVQDEASQLVPLALNVQPGERVLDLCASPGGKTVAIASVMHDSGVLVASDVRARRVALMRETIRSSGATHVHLVHIASEGPLPFDTLFDRVLVDAPCSGLGTVRRDPDIKWRRHDLEALAKAQLDLLTRAASVVRPGGRLVYATCSSEPEENDDVVRAFLLRHPEWRQLDLRTDATASLIPVIDDTGVLRTLPFVHGLEAFFAAALVRVRGPGPGQARGRPGAGLGQARGRPGPGLGQAPDMVRSRADEVRDSGLGRRQVSGAHWRSWSDIPHLVRRVDADRVESTRGRGAEARRDDGQRGDRDARRARARAPRR
jgi:16S rRNA (cytosine967-C5)-methyltransferase